MLSGRTCPGASHNSGTKYRTFIDGIASRFRDPARRVGNPPNCGRPRSRTDQNMGNFGKPISLYNSEDEKMDDESRECVQYVDGLEDRRGQL